MNKLTQTIKKQEILQFVKNKIENVHPKKSQKLHVVKVSNLTVDKMALVHGKECKFMNLRVQDTN